MMKKSFASKLFRRCAAPLMVLAVLAVLISPAAGAVAPYVDKVAQINEFGTTGILGIPHNQADNVMIYLLNRMYPVGSIFMWVPQAGGETFWPAGEPVLNSKAAMEAHFGGTWEPFAQGRIPVSAVAGTYPIGTIAAPNTGGTMGATGTTVRVPATGTINIDITTQVNNIGISTGYSTITNTTPTANGWATSWNPNGAKTVTFYATITADNLPAHTHSVVGVTVSTNSMSRSDTNVTWGHPTNRTNYSVTEAASYGSASLSCNMTFNISGVSLSFATVPSLAYSPAPSITHNQQTIASRNLTLAASGNVNVNDKTVQPYRTCFMFVRTGLAAYN